MIGSLDLPLCPDGEYCAFSLRARHSGFSTCTAKKWAKMKRHFEKYSHVRAPCGHGLRCAYHHSARLRDLLGLSQRPEDHQYLTEALLHCSVYSHPAPEKPIEERCFQYIPPIDRACAGLEHMNRSLEEEIRELDCHADEWAFAVARAREKLDHSEHMRLGRPLNEEQMIAVILYTSTNIQHQLSCSVRTGCYDKWRYLRQTLTAAIENLHEAQKDDLHRDYPITYSGFHNVHFDAPWLSDRFPVQQKRGIWRTSVSSDVEPLLMLSYGYFLSTSWSRSVAESFASGVDGGIILECARSLNMPAADVSWISTHRTEKEILMAPCTLCIREVELQQKRVVLRTTLLPGPMMPCQLQGQIEVLVPCAPVGFDASGRAVVRGFRTRADVHHSLFDLKLEIFRLTLVPPMKQDLTLSPEALQHKLTTACANKSMMAVKLGDIGLASGDSFWVHPSTLANKVPISRIEMTEKLPFDEHTWNSLPCDLQLHRLAHLQCKCGLKILPAALTFLQSDVQNGVSCVSSAEAVSARVPVHIDRHSTQKCLQRRLLCANCGNHIGHKARVDGIKAFFWKCAQIDINLLKQRGVELGTWKELTASHKELVGFGNKKRIVLQTRGKGSDEEDRNSKRQKNGAK